MKDHLQISKHPSKIITLERESLFLKFIRE